MRIIRAWSAQLGLHWQDGSGRRRAPLVLIVVQNLPLPGDRRVWLECQALRDAGYRVAAITPKGKGDPRHERYDGVDLYKYRPAPNTTGTASFVWEFLYCWLMTARLVITVWRRHGRPAVLQACNPPDTFWLLARVLRPFGVRFVYDQHDLCPELFESRFGGRGPAHRALLALESATYRSADHVIATNESYRRTAMTRGGVGAERVTVVRTGPDTGLLRRGTPDAELRRGRTHLVHFHGVMGPQDGVDLALRTVREVLDRGRQDVFFNVMGTGDEYQRLRRLVDDLGVADAVHMPGRVPDDTLFVSMSTADVGLCPDPPNPLNDVSTMNKTMEYMAFGLPVLAFDLTETRFSAGAAAHYVPAATPSAYADALLDLLDDPTRRAAMAEAGVRRAREELDWRTQRPQYVAVYDRLTAARVEVSRSTMGVAGH